MSSKKKNILNIGFLVLLLVLTFWLVFRDRILFQLHHPVRYRRTARSDILHAAPEN